MTITFVCLNLWPVGDLFPQIVQFLKPVQPDILALQEVFAADDPNLPEKFRAFAELKRQLDLPYGEFAPAFIENFPDKKLEQGNAVLSRFPLHPKKSIFIDFPYRERKENSRQEFETTPRNIQHVEVDLGKRKLQVFNIQGIWGIDGEDSERRLEMSQVIVDQIQPEIERHQPVILAGDFNIQPHTKTIQHIEQHLKNIFAGELKTTFNMQQKNDPGFATAVVDMVFVSSDIKILEHSCPQVNISDHLPLVAKLNITES
jgi:endonuclease/exonuclease/phosphatase family metal-dependent hydrolase